VSFGFSRDRWYNYIADRSHPPVASAAVEKPEYDPDHIYAWKPANNYKGWKLIDRGEAGVHDARVIQSAIDVGGKIAIATGEYLINRPLLIRKSNTTLCGFAMPFFHAHKEDITMLKADATINAIIEADRSVFDDGSPIRNILIERLYINGNYKALNGIDLTGLEYSTVRDCSIAYVTTYGIYIKQYNTTSARGFVHWILHNNIQSQYTAIRVESTDVKIYDNIIGPTNDTGIYLYDVAEATVVSRNHLSTNTNYGINVNKSGKIIISDNWVENNQNIGICITKTNNVTIQSNLIYRNVNKGIEVYTPSTSTMSNIAIIGNQFEHQGEDYLGNTASGNSFHIWLSSAGTLKNVKIIGNCFKSDGITTISIGFAGVGTIDNVAVIGNHSDLDEATVTVNFANWPTNTRFKGNNLKTDSEGTATFSGDGSKTQFSIAHGLKYTPTKVLVTPMTADAAGDFYVTANKTYIYINYKTAPPSGTDNVKVSWCAEV